MLDMCKCEKNQTNFLSPGQLRPSLVGDASLQEIPDHRLLGVSGDVDEKRPNTVDEHRVARDIVADDLRERLLSVDGEKAVGYAVLE
jgi:hypothetical protein